jgi:hypothetical protein
MRTALLLFILVLFAPLFAVGEVERASSQNIALAPSLLGAKNACNASSRLPSEDDIFSAADARIVSLIPQVGNTTSDLSDAAVLWSWSADFPNEARFSIRDDERCPAGEIRYFSPSSPSLSGALSYQYGRSTETFALSSGGANPIMLNLSAGKLTRADFLELFSPSSFIMRANLSITYSFSKSSYAYRCSDTQGYTGCGCERIYDGGFRTFRRSLYDARNFSVEVGPDSLLWLNPPISSRLAGEGNGKVALFARRMPANLSLVFRGKEVASALPYSFSVKTGQCGEAIVERVFSPSATAGLFLNASSPIFPSQLVDKNASYAPFYLEFPWHAEPGKGNFTIFFEDAFSNWQEFSREFYVREALPMVSSPGVAKSGGAMETRQASDRAASAAYPSRAQQAGFPDFSIIAAAFALPFAIALARRIALQGA